MTYQTKTRNDLYGVQVGITSIPDLPLLDCRSLTWSAKGGLYGNNAEQKSILNGTVGQRTDRLTSTNFFTGTGSDNQGNALFHGVTAGLTVRF